MTGETQQVPQGRTDTPGDAEYRLYDGCCILESRVRVPIPQLSTLELWLLEHDDNEPGNKQLRRVHVLGLDTDDTDSCNWYLLVKRASRKDG